LFSLITAFSILSNSKSETATTFLMKPVLYP
jgi:hypothetical protein